MATNGRDTVVTAAASKTTTKVPDQQRSTSNTPRGKHTHIHTDHSEGRSTFHGHSTKIDTGSEWFNRRVGSIEESCHLQNQLGVGSCRMTYLLETTNQGRRRDDAHIPDLREWLNPKESRPPNSTDCLQRLRIKCPIRSTSTPLGKQTYVRTDPSEGQSNNEMRRLDDGGNLLHRRVMTSRIF
eukprot:scaffold131148_cov40-Cyclotella_meneghiniana.AAC.2